MGAQNTLIGRSVECSTLDRLLDAVRGAESRTLVLRGEAGVGKTALLEYVVDSARDFHVLRAVGVESEMELAFASLHQLCGPILHERGSLPTPQRDALGKAFGLDDGHAPDRFLVALATLSLLSGAADERPLLCVIDDAQWLDHASALAVAFVARRLLAEPIGLVFAIREPIEVRELTGLPELTVGGLSENDARTLLDSALPGRLDDRVRDRIVAESRGNPLALLELPRGLAPAELAGGFGLPDTIPLVNRIEQSFVRRLEPLPTDTRQLLLIAAAEPFGDVSLLWRAASELQLAPAAAAPAEAAGLIQIGTRVRFRHPLVRSAVYLHASIPDRQQAHHALAQALDTDPDLDRRAWHRAKATPTPNETIALELEHSADRAQARGGIAAAAAFLQLATTLTQDPNRRGDRALTAAQTKFESAAPGTALELLAVADMCPLDELQRARHLRLRAEIVFALRRGRDAPPLLLDAARQLAQLDPALARETYLEALGAAMYAGRLYDENGVRKTAEAVRAGPPAPSPRSIDLVLDGMATRFTEGPGAGVPPLRTALETFRDETLDRHEELMRWLRLCPVVQSLAVFELWDDEAFHALATRAVRLAREAGALTILPVALVHLAGVHVFSGELSLASARIQEADAITAATGNTPLVYATLIVGAWRGLEAEALQLIEAGRESATARGEGRVLALAGYAESVLYNGLGRYEAAIASARRGIEDDDQGYAGWSLVELIEAATRSGSPDAAASALPRLEERTHAAGTDWALGILARSRALLSEGEGAEQLYGESIERLERTRMRVELARARLLYGEWLRREHRRIDARDQLRAAHDALSAMGAQAFAERAAHELLATGETARRRTVDTRAHLTPQEAQVARLARDGLSNPDIGARLYISPRTVQYHLRKVFLKLEITSRNQLTGVPADRLVPA